MKYWPEDVNAVIYFTVLRCTYKKKERIGHHGYEFWLIPFDRACSITRAGVGFSRPKPIFAVQNSINWDKPVFPSFSSPKLGKTIFRTAKHFWNVTYQTKIEQDRLENNLTKKLWAQIPKFVKKVFGLILIQITYSGLTMLMSHQLWCQAMSKVVSLLLCKNKMYSIWIINSQALNCEMILSLLWTCFWLVQGYSRQKAIRKLTSCFHIICELKRTNKIWDSMIHWLNITWTQFSILHMNLEFSCPVLMYFKVGLSLLLIYEIV